MTIRIALLMDKYEEHILMGNKPRVGQDMDVSLALNLDDGYTEWRHLPAAKRGAPTIFPSAQGLTAAFTGRVLRRVTVPLLDNPLHHVECLLDCGIPLTAFSSNVHRLRVIAEGDWIEGTGYVFANSNGSSLTLEERVRALVKEVRPTAENEVVPRNDWLVVWVSFDSRAR